MLGQALNEALGDRSGITRYGSALVPMDEARASAAIDISGRPFVVFEAQLPPGATGGFDHELTEEFLRAFANAAKLTLHVTVETGSNAHHMIEAAFKAFARALREAVSIDPTEQACRARRGRSHHMIDSNRAPISPGPAIAMSAGTEQARAELGWSTTAWVTAAQRRRRSSASARIGR